MIKMWDVRKFFLKIAALQGRYKIKKINVEV
jgi:hypothetical protein